MTLRARIFGAFEAAELETDPVKRAEWMRFVVVGAGPTGVEMAGQLTEVARRTLTGNFRSINPADARVVLVDAADSVLGSFGHKLSARTVQQLQKLGRRGLAERDGHRRGRDRHRRAGRAWRDVADQHPLRGVGGRRAGVAAGPSARRANRHRGRPGRPASVNNDLTLKGHPEIFVVGDMINLKHYPGVAQVAIQGGKYAAEQINAG